MEEEGLFRQIQIKHNRTGKSTLIALCRVLEGVGNGKGPTFVMKPNSMKVNTSKLNEVWYVDFGELNHMTNHEEWFSHLEKPKQPSVIENIDDTTHPIEHISDVH